MDVSKSAPIEPSKQGCRQRLVKLSKLTRSANPCFVLLRNRDIGMSV